MSTQTQALTAAGATAVVSLQPGQSVTYSSTGTFTGYLRFQRSRTQGATWETVEAAAVDTNVTGATVRNNTTGEERYRFQAFDTDALTAWTGTATTVIADVNDITAELKDSNGKVFARVSDDGIEFVGTATVDGALSVVGAAAFAALVVSGAAEDGLTAHAGGTQAAALALSATKNFHRISVCATAGDSVKLPAATVGQAHYVRNDGATDAQIYGAATETINGVASATGVPLLVGSGRWYVCLTAGKWSASEDRELAGKWLVNASGALVPVADNTYDIGNGASDPRDLNLKRHAYIGGLLTLSGVEDTLTAHAGGTQAAALALSAVKNFHRISVCATAADSVKLPASTAGQIHFIRNDGVASAQVFGSGTETINGIATATGVALPANRGALFVCTTVGNWTTLGLVDSTGSGASVLATAPTISAPVISGQPSFTGIPVFLAKDVSNRADLTGDGTVVNVTFATEVVDQGANFASSVFTAPVTGTYRFSTTVTLYQIAAAHNVHNLSIVTTGQTFQLNDNFGAGANPFVGYRSMTLSTLAQMTAGDTAKVQCTISGGTKIIDFDGSTPGGITFSGEWVK